MMPEKLDSISFSRITILEPQIKIQIIRYHHGHGHLRHFYSLPVIPQMGLTGNKPVGLEPLLHQENFLIMAVMHGPQVISKLISMTLRTHKQFSFSVFIATTFYSTFGRNEDSLSISEFRMYGVMWSVFFTFHLSHWEKYNTGIMVSVISSSVCITEKSVYSLHISFFMFLVPTMGIRYFDGKLSTYF